MAEQEATEGRAVDGEGQETRRRTGKGEDPSSSITKGQERKEEAEDGNLVLKGLLQCVLFIGGMSFIMWLGFYLVVPPSPFQQSGSPDIQGPCQHVDSVQEAIHSLKVVSDLELLGAELSVNPHMLADILAAKNRNTDHKQIELIQAWYNGDKVHVCWETVMKVLASAGETNKARNVANKYGCEWSE